MDETPKPRRLLPKMILLTVPVMAILAVLVVINVTGLLNRYPYAPPEKAFAGDSSKLIHTVIVPTLDTPAPEGRNVIWCAGFQIAWNRLRDDVIAGPIQVANAQPVADRLNGSSVTEAHVPPGGVFAAAGRVDQGILDTIRTGMAKQFPDVAPDLAVRQDAILVAYSYLRGNVKFDLPFFDREGGDEFTDSAGVTTRVRTFGLFKHDDGAEVNRRLAAQIEVLYQRMNARTYTFEEFAIDPCRTSQPNQLILACLEPKATLAETLADLERKVSEWNAKGREYTFRSAGVLAVPDLHWKIDHHFAELEGRDKVLGNSGFTGQFISRASQTIEFLLDRSGASVASESNIHTGASSRGEFTFTRPFLIVLLRRGADQPFFVMWVDNAELICPEPQAGSP